jgi:hypothetical protein
MKKSGLKYFFFLFLVFGYSFVALGQTGSIRGNVFDRDSGEPIIYGTVTLEGTTIGNNTDIDGFFNIAEVPVGNHTIVATYIGYDTIKTNITLTEGEIELVTIYLQENSIELETVNVSARKVERKTNVAVSKVTVTQREIMALPSTGSEPDIAQYLQVLPGIVSTGDQGGQIYIRGGAPIQNKILLDGMTIYNPFHSIGFFSVFETEAVKSVEVLTGGFNAEYGGRISAIVDIKTREGNKTRYGGIISASPFQTKLLLEGPLIKFNENKGGSASFLLTGKKSYLDETSKTLYEYATSDSLGLPYSYTDLYGKLSFQSNNGSRFNFFGFNFQDQVNYSGIANLDWKASGGGLNFKLVPATSQLIIGGTVSFSNYDIELREADESPRVSGINGFNAALDFTYFGKNNEIKYGFELSGFRTELEFKNFVGITLNQFNNTTEVAGFFKYRQNFGPFVFEPSLRAQFYTTLGDISLEPRVSFKANLSDNFRLKMSGGLYSQNLISTVNERDIVNLFVGFLSGPEERIFKPGTRDETDHRLQKSAQVVFGIEADLGPSVELTVEPYFKRFNQLINVNRNKLSEQDPDFATETGNAFGIDFSLRYERPRFYFWSTYSLGKVERDDGDQIYPTNFDRRHNVNLLASYRFGGDRSWEFGARWNLGTGFPFTQTQGFYGQFNYLNGIKTNYQTENPDLGIIYADERNGGRLPDYHRLDISLKKRIEFTKYVNLEITASVTNAYDRQNIFYFDRIRFERVDQLPILPSLSVKLTF